MKRCHALVLIFLFNSISYFSFSQPYLDIVSLQGVFTRPSNIYRDQPDAVNSDFYSAVITYPCRFKNKSILAITAGYDQWQFSFNESTKYLQSGYLPITYIKPISETWRYSVTGIARFSNETSHEFNKDIWQLGGAVIVTHQFTGKLSLKGGLYYNKEFFGGYVTPLIGGEWKISDRMILFGLLPNVLNIDYKITERLHCGFAYRGITASFRLNEGSDYDYIRLDEGQFKLLADLYILKNLVINFEAGHSLLRRYSVGQLNEKNEAKRYNDGYIIKAGLYYRMWL